MSSAFSEIKILRAALVEEHEKRLNAAIESQEYLDECKRLRDVLAKLRVAAIDGQNELHGIRHGGPAKRTLRDIEKQCEAALG